MSIPVQTPFNLYIANGSTTVFPYRFLLNQASDLRVTANGKTVSSGFSVSGEGNQSGGQITFSTPPASGTKIAILRNIPLRRDTEYQDNGDLLASTINADFDRLWMAVQGVDTVKDLALSRSGQDVNYYDAKGMPVKNLGDPVDPQDAATKKLLDSAVTAMGQQVQDAKTHLDVVWQSVSQNTLAAKQSEANAATSEQQAAQHAQDASETLLKTQAAAEEAAINAATETTARLKNEFNSDVSRSETAATNAQTAETNAAISATEAKRAATTAASDAVSSAVPEAVKQVTAAVALDANRAETAATGAQQALEEAKLIAKTPGGKDGQSAYEIWKSQQPADADTSMAAYMAIYDTVKNIGATNIGGKYVPVIDVENVQQILDLPTGTVVEVHESTKSTEGAEDILPVPWAYLSVIANNGDPDGYMFTLHSRADGRTWIAYRDYGSRLIWVELGQADASGLPVGSYVLGDFYQPEGFNFFGYPVDGGFISDMALRGHNPDLPYRLKKFPGGTWKCMTLVSGTQGLYLRIR